MEQSSVAVMVQKLNKRDEAVVEARDCVKELPEFVLAPKHKFEMNGETIDIPSRKVRVYGYASWPSCPNCKREGPMDGFLLKPEEWPNAVIICGEHPGCGIFWCQIGVPPQDHTWTYIES